MNSQDVIRETFDSSNNALKVNVVAGGSGQATVNINSSATIFAVVNTGAVGDPKSFIGLTTAVIGSSPTIFAVVNTSASGGGNVTLDAGSKTQIVGNVTISDSKSYIGLVSVSGFTSPLPVTGTFYQATQPVSFGNVTITDAKTFIGLTTSVIGSAPTIFAVVNTTASASGNVTLDAGSKTQIVGNLTISDSKGFIGLVSVSGFANPLPVSFSGNVTLDAGSKTQIVGNLTISDSKGYIGLVSVSHAAWANPNTFIGLTTSVIGNAPILGASTNYIGLVTVANTVSTTFSGNVTLDDGSLTGLVAGANWIGLVSVSGSVGFSGNVTLDDGSLTGLVAGANWIGLSTVVVGNAPILGASTNYIGLVTVANTVTVGAHALSAGAAYIGLVTVDIGASHSVDIAVLPATPVGTNFIGLVTVAPHALTAGATWIGLVTASNGLAWGDPKTFIGLTTVVQGGGGTKYIGLVTCTNGVGTSFMGLVTVAPHALTVGAAWIGLATVELGAGESFIGLVTAWTRNAGSAKTLTTLPIAFSLASLSTIVTPGTNLSVNITNIVLSSDATVRLAIKSGATYLTGNASIGVTLMPGGGFVMSGSPDSPCWIGLPSGSLNFEKQDIGGTIARIGGHVVYFTE